MTYIAVLGGILYVLATIILFVACLSWWDDNQITHAVAAGVAAVLMLAGGITFLVKYLDDQSGRCGAGTTRVVYHHGKSSDAVCEVTAR